LVEMCEDKKWFVYSFNNLLVYYYCN
jgi:hypothetical protein